MKSITPPTTTLLGILATRYLPTTEEIVDSLFPSPYDWDFCLVVACSIVAVAYACTHSESPSIFTILAGAAILLLAHEFYLYWWHRLMHTPYFYQWHKQHHIGGKGTGRRRVNVGDTIEHVTQYVGNFYAFAALVCWEGNRPTV